MSIAECGDKPTLIDEIWLMLMLMLICCVRKTLFVRWKVLLKNRAKVFVIITLDVDRSLLLYAWWMKSVTELIEKECLLLILNTVTSLRCWWSVALYVQTAMVRLCYRIHYYCRDNYLYYATSADKLCHVSVHCYCIKYIVCSVSY